MALSSRIVLNKEKVLFCAALLVFSFFLCRYAALRPAELLVQEPITNLDGPRPVSFAAPSLPPKMGKGVRLSPFMPFMPFMPPQPIIDLGPERGQPADAPPPQVSKSMQASAQGIKGDRFTYVGVAFMGANEYGILKDENRQTIHRVKRGSVLPDSGWVVNGIEKQGIQVIDREGCSFLLSAPFGR